MAVAGTVSSSSPDFAVPRPGGCTLSECHRSCHCLAVTQRQAHHWLWLVSELPVKYVLYHKFAFLIKYFDNYFNKLASSLSNLKH